MSWQRDVAELSSAQLDELIDDRSKALAVAREVIARFGPLDVLEGRVRDSRATHGSELTAETRDVHRTASQALNNTRQAGRVIRALEPELAFLVQEKQSRPPGGSATVSPVTVQGSAARGGGL